MANHLLDPWLRRNFSMRLHNFKIGLMLGALALAGPLAHAGPPPVITESVGVCDYGNPKNCLAPDANGNMPIKPSSDALVGVKGTDGSTIASPANPVPGEISDGTNIATVKAASTLPALTDKALVVTQRDPLPPGTNQIGTVSGSNVGGYEFNATSIPTIQNAAYASGNCMGGFNALTVARTNGGGIILDTFGLRSVGGGTTAIQVYIFNANPSASTCTDKSTFTINSADIDKIIAGGTFQLTPAATTGTSITFAYQSNMALSVIAGGSSGSGVQTIYYALVSTGTWTPASTTDLHVQVNGIQD